VAAGFIIGEHLIKLGCRRICFVSPPNSAPTIDARIAGLRQAKVRHGLSNEEGWIFEGEGRNPVFVRKVLGQGKPEAIVCSNDYTAAVLMQSLAKAGIRVPQDMKVVGFDDVRFATLVSPPLTTVHQPYREIAVTAFGAMMDRLEQPLIPTRQISLTPRLVIRDSCGAYQ
ncbi:MAG TPA: substrate-binding domain-containing protein, partial [Pirellulaceae bacterium]